MIKYHESSQNRMQDTVFGKGQGEAVEMGEVVDIEGDLAKIRMHEQAACGSCSASGVCHPAMATKPEFEVANTIGAKVGDIVEIEVYSSSRILASLVVFGLPVVFLLLGAIFGMSMENATQDTAVVGAIAGLALGFVIVNLINRFVQKVRRLKPYITKVVTSTAS